MERNPGGRPMTRQLEAVSPGELALSDRVAEAYRIKITGVNDTDGAKAMGVSVVCFRNYLKKYIQERPAQDAEEYRQLLIDRGETLLAGVWQSAVDGDPKAVLAATKLLDSLYKYKGLESLKVEHSGSVSSSPTDHAVYGPGGLLDQLRSKDSPVVRPTSQIDGEAR